MNVDRWIVTSSLLSSSPSLSSSHSPRVTESLRKIEMGGGVIRTAAKAGVSGAFRSSLGDEVGRRAARQQVSSFVPAVESELVAPTLSAGYGRTEASAVAVAAHWPRSEFDEWVLTGGREDSFESVGVAPRLVFGPVPTLGEAMEATTDLKDALEKVYFTPQHTVESNEVCQATAHGECSTVSSAPKHITRMFYLLQENSEAQGVVASLASDENVWNAVMKNEKVVQFCKKASPETFEKQAESVAESHAPDVFSSTVDAKETSEGSLLNKIKVKVSQMVSNISDFIKDYFWTSTGESSSSNEKSTSSTSDNTNMAFGAASFLGLAVATIMVVLLKRG